MVDAQGALVPATRVCMLEGDDCETLVMWTNINGTQMTDETRRTIHADGTMTSQTRSTLHGKVRTLRHRREEDALRW